jgi:uncharacterized membrane protein (DUF373 family)
MHKVIWYLHKICIAALLFMLILVAMYAYDIAACFHGFGFYSDDCHETTSFVLDYILPILTVAALIASLALRYLSNKLRTPRNRLN